MFKLQIGPSHPMWKKGVGNQPQWIVMQGWLQLAHFHGVDAKKQASNYLEVNSKCQKGLNLNLVGLMVPEAKVLS